MSMYDYRNPNAKTDLYPYLNEEEKREYDEMKAEPKHQWMAAHFLAETGYNRRHDAQMAELRAKREANGPDDADAKVARVWAMFDELTDAIYDAEDALKAAGFQEDFHGNAEGYFNEAANNATDGAVSFGCALSTLGYNDPDADEDAA